MKAAKYLALVAAAVLIINPHLGIAGNQTVVSIFVDGNEKVVSTEAATVGEVLERANIEVGSNDLVEPTASTAFTSEVFNINVYRAKPVVVVDTDKEIKVTSPYQSPKLIAERSAGVVVYPEDEYRTELIRDVSSGIGMKVYIERATSVVVKVDGVSLPLRTQKDTVGEMFSEKGITVADTDVVNVPRQAKITKGMEIEITRVGEEVVATEEIIPAPVQYIYDDTKPGDYEQIQEAGAEGKRFVTYRVIRHDGQEVGREELQVVVVNEAKPKVVVRGLQHIGGADWAGLRFCESGGNYQNKNNPLYRGAYQFSYGTWASLGGSTYDPADASPGEQDSLAIKLYQRSGKYQWPVCGPRYLP